MNSVIFLLLRRLRGPLIFGIVSHSIAVLGLTLIPGADINGHPAPPLDFFHAFYFITYTATTIGYTEPVAGFSDAQRLWITGCIYLLVISWSFVIVTLLACLQDKGFQNALVAGRFARRLHRLREPFYLICGYGETGHLVCRALDHMDQRFVVLEQDETRIQALELEDYRTDTLTLVADVCKPGQLMKAGLRHPWCRGVLALTHEESTNLAVVMAVRLLNPAIPVLARARSASVAANMVSFGVDHIINPFERFAEYLSLAAASPGRYRLVELLTGLPGTSLPEAHHPPKGLWIVCGYGIFGHAVVRNLEATGNSVVIIDPHIDAAQENHASICGTGTDAATLERAGARSAQGIVAGSDDDVSNLAIAITARELHPEIFIVTRQNKAANSTLFDAFIGDFCMVPSHIVAQECLAILTTPLLARFLQRLRERDEDWNDHLVTHLQSICHARVPEVWALCLNARSASAIHRRLADNLPVTLGELLRSGTNPHHTLPIIPLLLEREGQAHLLPAPDTPLHPEDQLLFAAPHGQRSQLELTLLNDNALSYVLEGHEQGSGWLWKKLTKGSARQKR